jgi:DNA helicase II / ATP-dependent DNA helicase PcrA
MVKLSEEQKKIVEYNEGEGPLLVLASAGSGKTRVLTERVRYLLTQKQGAFMVLCLTFTNKAAEEMQERLKDVKGIKDKSFIGTVHGFALEIIKSKRHEIGYSDMPQIIERENDRKKILEQVFIENPVLHEFYVGKTSKEQNEIITKILDWISSQKKDLVIIDDNINEFENWDIKEFIVYKSYNALLKEQNLIEFDDLLLLAWRILNESISSANLFRRLYQYILIDEAQDLNYAQYELIKSLCGETNRNVLMVGDPNQAIHGYAGSDEKFMNEYFVKDFKLEIETEKKVITHNYRSSEAVIDFANRIMPKSISIGNSYYKGCMKILPFVDENAEADWIIASIEKMLLLENPEEIEGGISLEKIAILARNKFVFNILKEKLNNHPTFQNNYFIKKGSDLLELESKMMKVFDLGTRILSNMYNQVHYKQILNLLDIKSLENALENTTGLQKLELIGKAIPNSKEFKILLQAWNILEETNCNMFDAFKKISDEIESPDVVEEIEKELILNDLKEFELIWRKFLKGATSTNILTSFRQYLALGGGLQKKEKGLTLATVHTVKGLEFDIVFVMGMNDGTFPDYRAKNQSQLLEEKNSFYVAVTRARRWLFITYPLKKMMPWGDEKNQVKSRFISSI